MDKRKVGSELDVMGVRLRVIVSSDATSGTYSVVEQLDRPGAGSPPHANGREDIIIGVVEGDVEVHLPDGPVSLAAGKSISVPRNTKHWTRNAGSGQSRTLYTFVPGGFEAFFVEVADLGTTPDLEQVATIATKYGQEIAPPEGELLGTSHGNTEAAAAAQDPHEIPRLFEERFNAGDVDGMLELYESDAVLIPQPGGPMLQGREALQEALGGFIATGAMLELNDSRVIQAGDVALLIHDGHLFGGSPPDGSPIDLTSRSSDVARRQQDGTWRIVIDNPWGTV
ncbi:MAG: DUF4440 domain-containing protein [Candidatus Methylomirabilaceae bacterium]